jgi:O-antigen/teichoic acid export membrane protein
LYKKLAGQTLIYGLGTVVPRLLNYSILTIYYTRLFSVEQFGVLTELYAYVTFLLIFLTYGMETGYFRFSIEDKDGKAYSSIIISLFITSAAFLLGVLIFQSEIAGVLDYRGNSEFITMLAAVVAIDAFCAIPFAKLRKEERSIKFSALKIVNVLVTIVSVVFFYELLPWIIEKYPMGLFIKLRTDITYVLLANLIGSVIVLIFLLPEIFDIKLVFKWNLLKQILIYSLPLLLAGLAGTINETLDRVMMKYLITDKKEALYALGIYGANYKIATLLLIFIQMFRYAIEPFYFNYYGKKDDKAVFAQIMRLFIAIMVVLCLFIMLYLKYMKYFISAKFHEGLFIVPIILASYVIYGVILNLSIWYKLTKQTVFGAVVTIVGAALTIIINFIYVPKYSYTGAAVGHIVAYVVMMVISYIWGQKYFYVDYKLGRITEYILVALFIFVLDWYIIPDFFIFGDVFKGILLVAYSVYIIKREKLISINKLIKWKLG